MYINRINKDMPLQADPTIKFAMRDFGLKRIYEKYSSMTPSPYNTYLNKGLPPGRYCTPSAGTLNAVINAPKTDYMYFVANSDLNGSFRLCFQLSRACEKCKTIPGRPQQTGFNPGKPGKICNSVILHTHKAKGCFQFSCQLVDQAKSKDILARLLRHSSL